MPIYEFACPNCRVIFSFLAKTTRPDRAPACPKCGGRRMHKQVSCFASPKGVKEPAAPGPDGGEEPGVEVDEARMMRAMSELEKEVSSIPRDAGVYWLNGREAKVLKLASSSVRTNKGRQVLKVLSPIPIVTGKGTLELDGAHSQNVFTDPEQPFYIQLSDTERFGVARLTVKGAVRVVESLTFIPITKEVEEELNLVDIFRQQLGNEDLYKIWPKDPLEPGEYAVVQYTAGKLNIQVWDFAIARAK